MASPYSKLPTRNFWRSGVAGADRGEFPAIYVPKFPITPTMAIGTAGSCFAQHVGRRLRAMNYRVLDAEPPPPGLPAEMAQNFGFNLYSARHGNIYTVRQLLQLAREAFGEFEPGDAIWHRDGRWYDALRPTVEPTGLSTERAVRAQRAQHLAAFRDVLARANLFVFTMGLTEAWVHQPTGTTYPTAPGVVAESASPEAILLKNFTFPEIHEDFLQFRSLAKRRNPDLRFLLTVSPVPLTATATDNHVLVATTYSKSVLRAVAGQLCNDHDDIDYFPSYEIVAGHPSRGRFYAPNMREVTAEGVACVMQHFSAAVSSSAGNDTGAAMDDTMAQDTATPPAEAASSSREEEEQGLVCEDALLEAFGRGPSNAQ